VDIRHEPGANDKQMYDWIRANGYEPVIIGTKLDKLKKSQVQKNVQAVRKGLGMEPDRLLIPFSAETKQGREEIWALIDALIAQTPTENE
jgi:GTP-binding protein